MFKKTLYISLLLSIFSCVEEAKKDFTPILNDFVKEYAPLFPDETPLSIDNLQLANLHIPSDSTLDSLRHFHQKFSDEIQDFKLTEIPPPQQADFNKMKKILQNIDFYVKNAPINPTYFNVLYGFQRILNTPYAPADRRMQTLFDKLAQVPAFYEAAKTQLDKADVKKADETLEKHFLTYNFFDKTLPNALKKEHFMTPQYQAHLEAAKLAIKDYVAFVESLRLE